MRRATHRSWRSSNHGKHFYPRSPCGERQIKNTSSSLNIFISIHALLAESDRLLMYFWLSGLLFLSTLSLRRATLSSDPERQPSRGYFYPRSPCGERRWEPGKSNGMQAFLSTLSLRRATLFLRSGPMMRRYFYPRSPCGERPLFLRSGPMMRRYFYPRSPCGERRSNSTKLPTGGHFYPRSPCGERH